MVAKSNGGAANNKDLSQDIRSDLQSHSEPQHLPLNPDAQRKIKALISQIRIALQRQQLDAEVHKQLHQLAEDLRLAEGAGPSGPAQRLERLVKRVERVLSTGQLTTKVQEELAELLSLVSAMHDYPNHISELELAVSALLPGAFTAADALPDRQILGASAQSPAGLKLARKLRNHLRLKTHQHPFPIQSLLSASGSGQNRLFSGLSWFLLIFSLLPALAYGSIMISGIGERDDLRRQRDASRADLRQQERRVIFLEGKLDRIGTRIARLDTRNQNLEKARQNATASLSGDLNSEEGIDLAQQTQVQLAEQPGGLAEAETNSSPEPNNDEPTATYLSTLNQLLNTAEEEVQAQQSLIDESQVILAEEFEENREGTFPSNSQSPSDDNGTGNGEPTNWEKIVNNLIEAADDADLLLMLAVVSAGALGGFVSVIVRAGDLVKKSEEKPLDLFFVGFFRPVIGMTFAFFLVAMLESGLFSGIFTPGRSDQRGESDRNIYLYIAISFVAGFSERLVRDFVSQTERQITGVSASQRDNDS